MSEFNTDAPGIPEKGPEKQDLCKEIEDLRARNRELISRVDRYERRKEDFLKELERGMKEQNDVNDAVVFLIDRYKQLTAILEYVIDGLGIISPSAKGCSPLELSKLPDMFHELLDLRLSNDFLMDYFTTILPGFERSGTRLDSAEAVINRLEALWAKQREFARKVATLIVIGVPASECPRDGQDIVKPDNELNESSGASKNEEAEGSV